MSLVLAPCCYIRVAHSNSGDNTYAVFWNCAEAPSDRRRKNMDSSYNVQQPRKAVVVSLQELEQCLISSWAFLLPI